MNTLKKNTFEIFGNYILLKKLAVGGMAEVFLARPATQSSNGRIQVIKRLLPQISNDVTFIKMFQKEIQVLLGFCHPNTVQLHDFGKIDDQPYIVMEYIEGKNLKDLIVKLKKEKNTLPIPMVLSLMTQASAGLDYAHRFVNKVTGETANAVHRDVSPHNLIASYDGNLKVIDFGIAKVASSLDEQTRVGTIKGKTAYLSPEQIHGKPVDARTDVFSLGIVAWELLTLKRPFSQIFDEVQTIEAILQCDKYIVPPSTYNKQVSPDLDKVILKALRENPDNRYKSAGEFRSALRQCLQEGYPYFSYSDAGSILRSLFAEEIKKDSDELFLLNLEAQEDLSKKDSTLVVSSSAEPMSEIELPKGKNQQPQAAEPVKKKRKGDHFSDLIDHKLNIQTDSILKSYDTGKGRVWLKGGILIYDLKGKIITKGHLRNCGEGGIGFESGPCKLKPMSSVVVEIFPDGQGLELGPMKCDVRWLNPIDGHFEGNSLGGLRFSKMTLESSKKLNDYLKNYNKSYGFKEGDR